VRARRTQACKADVTEDFKRAAILQITERGCPIAEAAARLAKVLAHSLELGNLGHSRYCQYH